MERHERDVLGELPTAYAVALRLLDTGASHQLIASALGVEPESVPTLIDLARVKTRELLDRAPAPCTSPGGST